MSRVRTIFTVDKDTPKFRKKLACHKKIKELHCHGKLLNNLATISFVVEDANFKFLLSQG
jgi:hypothetical protein